MNESGSIVFELSVNSKLLSNIARPIRACIIPNRSPMQFLLKEESVNDNKNEQKNELKCYFYLGPSPKGSHDSWSLSCTLSEANLSGSNLSGFG